MQNNENPNNNYCSIHISCLGTPSSPFQTDSPPLQKEQANNHEDFRFLSLPLSLPEEGAQKGLEGINTGVDEAGR